MRLRAQAALDPDLGSLHDRRRLIALLVALVGLTGGGVVLVAATGHSTGPWAIHLDAKFLIPFGALIVAHGALYALAPRATARRWRHFLYLALQLLLAAALVAVAGRAGVTGLFFVAWCAQGVAITPQRWPLVLIVGGAAAFLTVTEQPTVARVIGGGVTILGVVLALYLIQFVRGTLMRRELRVVLGEIRESRTQLGSYAAEVEEAALVEERRRLARDLHDTLAQGLVGVTLQLEAADAQLEQGGLVRAREIVQQTMEHARETLREARKAIDDLRSDSGGSGSGLDASLRTEVRRFSAATGIPVDLTTRAFVLPAESHDHVRRVVAEGLLNVGRHARATRVELSMRSVDGHMEIVVRDDGVGFDPRSADAVRAGHYGLIGLAERARALGGSLVVESAPGAGTELRLHFPIARTSPNAAREQ